MLPLPVAKDESSSTSRVGRFLASNRVGPWKPLSFSRFPSPSPSPPQRSAAAGPPILPPVSQVERRLLVGRDQRFSRVNSALRAFDGFMDAEGTMSIRPKDAHTSFHDLPHHLRITYTLAGKTFERIVT